MLILSDDLQPAARRHTRYSDPFLLETAICWRLIFRTFQNVWFSKVSEWKYLSLKRSSQERSFLAPFEPAYQCHAASDRLNGCKLPNKLDLIEKDWRIRRVGKSLKEFERDKKSLNFKPWDFGDFLFHLFIYSACTTRFEQLNFFAAFEPRSLRFKK